VRFRTGRKNGRNIYLMEGLVPSDDDRCVAFAVDPAEASALVMLLNATDTLASTVKVVDVEVSKAREVLAQ